MRLGEGSVTSRSACHPPLRRRWDIHHRMQAMINHSPPPARSFFCPIFSQPSYPPKLGFAGVIGTWVLGFCGMVAAGTGANAAALRRADIPFRACVVHPAHHVSYYPGAKKMALKLLYGYFVEGGGAGAETAGRNFVGQRQGVFLTATCQGSLSSQTVRRMAECWAPRRLARLAWSEELMSSRHTSRLVSVRLSVRDCSSIT